MTVIDFLEVFLVDLGLVLGIAVGSLICNVSLESELLVVFLAQVLVENAAGID